MTEVKICGLKDSENLKAAIDAGAGFVGFVFFEGSPRNIDFHTAANLRQLTPENVKAVGLFVNPSNADLEKFAVGLRLDMIQLHGEETPDRIMDIKRAFGIPVMKAIRIGDKTDLEQLDEFLPVADWLLFDVKVEGEHGGTGKSFDWSLLRRRKIEKPWMLSGGLNAGNVASALGILRPKAVDVSSGVEIERGVKDAAKIRAFIKAAKR
ncbi:MAG TPA: phosphoribosylanthranilate isomerase [Alphaproteobacteria bacterium]|nr:phosphoribosylanthranilate isomerase [Micavibrio sp.]MBK9562530.1 phosphoribosylanthranilate isomerase [Micavibrio sp.]HQX27600.1 phosphoribosylanthranilate isomerase [Alphaproteobacteria bacterium]